MLVSIELLIERTLAQMQRETKLTEEELEYWRRTLEKLFEKKEKKND